MQALLTLLIFTLPFGVLTRVNIFDNVYLYLQDIFVGILFLIFAYKYLKKDKLIIFKKISTPLIGFVAIGFISLAINYIYLTPTTFIISLLYAVRFFAYSLLIFIAANNSYSEKLILKKCLIIAGAIFTMFGFIQYIFYQNLRNLYYAGWDDHLYRLFSTALDPNFAGILLVLVFLLTLFKLLTLDFSKKNSYLIAILGILELVAIYLTYSRSAFIALVVGVLTMLYFLNRKRMLIPALLVMLVGLILFANTKIEGLNPFRTVSSIARINTAREAVDIYLKNPILGVGFDSLRYAQIRYGYRNANISIPSNADAGTDNSYLFVLTTTGILGFVFYVKFIGEILKNLFNSITSKEKQSVAGLSSVLAILFASFFINALFYPMIMMWMFILIGTSLIQSKKR